MRSSLIPIPVFWKMSNTWANVNQQERGKPYFHELKTKVIQAYGNSICYPPRHLVFQALRVTPLEDVKVVILGQDPYHGEHQAMGLSFSVPSGVPIPPTLVNIYKEIENEFGKPSVNPDGDLTPWAKQGVLLLNTVLTVEANKAGSHHGMGWEQYTDALISAINDKENPVVFMLWGNPAKSKERLISNPAHLVLEAAHPSPLSAYRGFFGCGHFKIANEFLEDNNMSPIVW